MDHDSALLICTLQFEDTEKILSSTKGKGREGCCSDEELAVQIFQRELETYRSDASDQRMAQSIADAVRTDGTMISDNLAQEIEAVRDHDLASRLSGQRVVSEVRAFPTQPFDVDEDYLAKLTALYVVGDAGTEASKGGSFDESTRQLGESSATGSQTNFFNSFAKRKCEACQEYQKFSDVARAPCNHEYCRKCLCSLFEASFSDESLFPPRCCKQAFLLGRVRIFLNPELVKRYEEVSIEFNTSDRVYCAQPYCSTFIHPKNIQDGRASCSNCGTSTCQWCKLPYHGGECSEDTALQDLLHTATQNGWQRCFSCRRVIELELGCNHITCICGAQFCYACGERWRTCRCDQWNEDRLLARANQLLDRNQPPPEVRQAQMVDAIQNLRENHQCRHQEWNYVAGAHRCDQCASNLPSYIFECRQCHIMACNRCRRNRL